MLKQEVEDLYQYQYVQLRKEREWLYVLFLQRDVGLHLDVVVHSGCGFTP